MPEISRGHAVDLFEDAGEVVRVVEADGLTDGFDRAIGAQEQFRGVPLLRS